MSYASLVLDVGDAEPAAQLLERVALLVVECRGTEAGDRFGPVDRDAFGRLRLVVVVAGLLDALADLVDRLFPRDGFPLGLAGATHLGRGEAVGVDVLLSGLVVEDGVHRELRRALRTHAAAVDRMVGVTLDVEELSVTHRPN